MAHIRQSRPDLASDFRSLNILSLSFRSFKVPDPSCCRSLKYVSFSLRECLDGSGHAQQHDGHLQTWHMYDNHGQILSLVFRRKSLKCLELFHQGQNLVLAVLYVSDSLTAAMVHGTIIADRSRGLGLFGYRDTSLIRKRQCLGPYRSPCLGSSGGPRGVVFFS